MSLEAVQLNLLCLRSVCHCVAVRCRMPLSVNSAFSACMHTRGHSTELYGSPFLLEIVSSVVFHFCIPIMWRIFQLHSLLCKNLK